MNDEATRDLARRAGIAVEWRDAAGRDAVVSVDVLRSILAALGLPCGTRGDLAASRRKIARKSSLAALPPLITATASRPTRLEVVGDAPCAARLLLEAGGARDLTLQPTRGRLRVPPISDIGYHRLQFGERQIVLAVAPTRCNTLDDAVPDARLWGLAVQVYALRQQGDGGIGDAAGIATLAEAAGRRGADALALSPLHALFTADPTQFGPYSPSSRLFLNPLHASPSLVFGRERVAQVASDIGIGESLAHLEAAPMIDWKTAATAKLALMRALFETFLTMPDFMGRLGADFARFRSNGGENLVRHAVFEVLHAEQIAAGQSDWREWPVDLREPDSPTIATFAASHRRDVLLQCFMQWIADRSLAAAQLRARQAGMRIGLIADLAVGMNPAGSHAWSHAEDLLRGLSIGAPPDLFNPSGQNWGLTSFSPRALSADGFGAFIATLRAALRNTGGVRIDHAMGLARMWLIPEGGAPSEGAYLSYPFADLLRLLALESRRHQAIVVGEDLGTVPEGFRENLEQAGVHGMRVLWFERRDSGFTPVFGWSRGSVAMTSTHDLPTVAGWWHGSDIRARVTCGGMSGSARESEELAREADRSALWQALAQDGDAAGPVPPADRTQPVVDAALTFVARARSPLALLPLEDMLGREEQPNLPGTIDQYPNWRLRLTRPAETLLDEPATAARVERLAKERPRQ